MDYITFDLSSGDDIGFYIQVVQTGNIYYTESSRNTSATNMQHFALFGMSDGSYYNWKTKYAGLSVSELKRLKALEEENRRLKQIVAEQALDNRALKELLSKNF